MSKTPILGSPVSALVSGHTLRENMQNFGVEDGKNDDTTYNMYTQHTT